MYSPLCMLKCLFLCSIFPQQAICWSLIRSTAVGDADPFFLYGITRGCPGIENPFQLNSLNEMLCIIVVFQWLSPTQDFKVRGTHQRSLNWHPGKRGLRRAVCLLCIYGADSVISVKNISLTVMRSISGLCSEVLVQLIQQPEWLIQRYLNPVLQFGLVVIKCT